MTGDGMWMREYSCPHVTSGMSGHVRSCHVMSCHTILIVLVMGLLPPLIDYNGDILVDGGYGMSMLMLMLMLSYHVLLCDHTHDFILISYDHFSSTM